MNVSKVICPSGYYISCPDPSLALVLTRTAQELGVLWITNCRPRSVLCIESMTLDFCTEQWAAIYTTQQPHMQDSITKGSSVHTFTFHTHKHSVHISPKTDQTHTLLCTSKHTHNLLPCSCLASHSSENTSSADLLHGQIRAKWFPTPTCWYRYLPPNYTHHWDYWSLLNDDGTFVTVSKQTCFVQI